MKLFFLTLIVLFSANVLAGKQIGKIETLYARASDGLHLVLLTDETQKSGSPPCAAFNYWIIKDESSTAGKSQFSQLLAAQVANKTVYIDGGNTCSRWRDGEDINTITIRD